MPVHAVQMVRLAVQEKSPVGINRIETQAQRLFDTVHGHAIRGPQFHHGLIEIRVLASVPQMRLRHGEAQKIRRGVARRQRDRRLGLDHSPALRVQHAGDQASRALSAACRWRFAPSRPAPPGWRSRSSATRRRRVNRDRLAKSSPRPSRANAPGDTDRHKRRNPPPAAQCPAISVLPTRTASRLVPLADKLVVISKQNAPKPPRCSPSGLPFN